jgi:hypothetical protein
VTGSPSWRLRPLGRWRDRGPRLAGKLAAARAVPDQKEGPVPREEGKKSSGPAGLPALLTAFPNGRGESGEDAIAGSGDARWRRGWPRAAFRPELLTRRAPGGDAPRELRSDFCGEQTYLAKTVARLGERALLLAVEHPDRPHCPRAEAVRAAMPIPISGELAGSVSVPMEAFGAEEGEMDVVRFPVSGDLGDDGFRAIAPEDVAGRSGAGEGKLTPGEGELGLGHDGLPFVPRSRGGERVSQPTHAVTFLDNSTWVTQWVTRKWRHRRGCEVSFLTTFLETKP